MEIYGKALELDAQKFMQYTLMIKKNCASFCKMTEHNLSIF